MSHVPKPRPRPSQALDYDQLLMQEEVMKLIDKLGRAVVHDGYGGTIELHKYGPLGVSYGPGHCLQMTWKQLTTKYSLE